MNDFIDSENFQVRGEYWGSEISNSIYWTNSQYKKRIFPVQMPSSHCDFPNFPARVIIFKQLDADIK